MKSNSNSLEGGNKGNCRGREVVAEKNGRPGALEGVASVRNVERGKLRRSS